MTATSHPTLTVTATDLHGPHSHQPGDPTTGYLRFWLPILGPSTTLLYRHLLDATGNGAHTAVVDLADTANDLGLGRSLGPNSAILRTVARLSRYRLAVPDVPGPGHLRLVTRLPQLNNRQLDQLRPGLARAEQLHRANLATELTNH